MHLESLLSELGQYLGIQDLGLNENGVCSLQFDGRITVHIEPEEEVDTVHVYTVVCTIPEDPEERDRLFAALLEANLFGRGTNHACFGIDPDDKQVVLSQAVDSGKTDAHGFRDAIEAFVNVVAAWLDRLQDILSGEEAAEVAFNGKMDAGPGSFIKV